MKNYIKIFVNLLSHKIKDSAFGTAYASKVFTIIVFVLQVAGY